MRGELLLRATALALGYGDEVVLRDVDLEIRREAFWFVVGPNGTGKSTLLRALLGDLRPLHGEIWRAPELESAKRVGFVPQRCDLNPALPTTVHEFVRLGLVNLRVPRDEARESLGSALREVGLHGMEDRDYWSLSGGQRQRALLARALVRRPTLLVLDEPTNGLDLASERSVLRFLERLNRMEHLTIVFVTHDLPLASRYASDVALLHDRTLEAGPRDSLLTEDRLKSVYGLPVRITGAGTARVAIEVDGEERR